MGCIISECAVVMVDCRMIDHIRHTERSEQKSEDVWVFLVLAAKGLGKTIRYNDIRDTQITRSLLYNTS
jgi:hypothetical protein